jgi:hypothetical protein
MNVGIKKEAKMLTDQQQKIITLSKQLESLKEQLKNGNEELNQILSEVGVGTSFQDPSDGTVFEIVIPKGGFVSYHHIGYDRTRREGERSGSLSLKRAKELGFDVK